MKSFAAEAVCAPASVLNGDVETPVPFAPELSTYHTLFVTVMLTVAVSVSVASALFFTV